MNKKIEAIITADQVILRDLARRVAEIAALPIQRERIRLWKQHNALRRPRAMILVFPEGAWRELLPESVLRCQGERARRIEWELRSRLYAHEHFASDNVVTADWPVPLAITQTDWGLTVHRHNSDQTTGAFGFDPVINEPADMKKLRFPVLTYDEPASQDHFMEMQALFGDILNVRQQGVAHVSFHLMNLYTGLRGLEQVMIDMVENPGWLHEAMAFLEEGHRRLVQQYVDLNLLCLNNDNTYHASGGVGWSDELPPADADPRHVRPRDIWASAESQELAQVSPAMHAEFALPYEKRLLAPFGLNGYGCCENLTLKLVDVLTIPHLRRVSISPWADVDACALKLGNRFIFSWKPHPAHLAARFDPEMIRGYIRHTLEVTRGGVVEMILKDTHTCDNHPERFDQWARIARELVEEMR